MGRAPPDGSVIGLIGGPQPRRALERAGHRIAYSDHLLAIAGSVTESQPLEGESLVVGGRMVVDDSATRASTAVADAWGTGGSAAVMALQGMFGAAVYSADQACVTLLRDPLGERTIYHTAPRPDGSVWFSDRLSSLRRAGVVSSDVSLAAMRDYLIFAYVPGTQTMLADAREVGPGTSVTLRPGQVEPAQTWWKLKDHSTDRSMEENAEELRSLLVDAVVSRRPEGPVGVYLSGGVDSSAITALLCQQDPDDVHTFAVHFGHDLPNELSFVDQVVDRCKPGTHHEIELTSTELGAALPDTMAALDDPIGDPLTVPNLALGRRASEIVGTIFNGEGGDPVFGGPKNQPMLLAALYGQNQSTQPFGVSQAIDTVYLRSYQKCFDNLASLLRPEVRCALANSPAPTAHVAPYLSQGSMSHFVDRLFEANTRLKGCDHILTKVANITAAAGVVGRSPLFDRQVVEAAFAMPPGHKLEGTIEKTVLKRAVADLLPAPIIDRPKAGMRVPVQTWFRGPLRRQGSKQLLSRKALITDYLDRSTIKEWTKYDGDPQGRYGRKLWLLLSLEHWLQAQNN